MLTFKSNDRPIIIEPPRSDDMSWSDKLMKLNANLSPMPLLFRSNSTSSVNSDKGSALDVPTTPKSTGSNRSSFFSPTSPPPPKDASPRSALNQLTSFFSYQESDPRVKSARQKILEAEAAEREADKALQLARKAAKAARDGVRELEKEAEEETRRAKAKQAAIQSVSKSVRNLGKHD